MAREIVEQVDVKGPKGKKGIAILYDDGTIFVEWVRFSHPHISKPWKKEGDKGKPKYSVTGMLGKKTHKKAIALIQQRIDEILEEAKVRKLPADKLFMRDGDNAEAEEYEGFMTVSCREERRPPMRHKNGKPIQPGEDEDGINESEDLFVGGHWGAILMRPWWQNSKEWGKRVNCGLSSIQYLMKDETFGSGRLSEEELDNTFRSHDDDDDDDGSYDDDDEDDRPRRGKKPARRSRDDDDDDEDERPRRRRSRDDDDDDEDEAPRKKPKPKRKPVDDDDDDDI